MASILKLMNTPAPADTKNTKKLVRDTLVEFLATTTFIYAGTLAALSTVSYFTPDSKGGWCLRLGVP